MHGHGAVIARKALEKLADFQSRSSKRLWVYAFGGTALIPNQLANRVLNSVFDQDKIAGVGNIKSDMEEEILEKIKKVETVKFNYQWDTRQAILEMAYLDLVRKLNPHLEIDSQGGSQDREFGNQKYEQIFIKKDFESLEKDESFKEILLSYSRCYGEYNVAVLRDTDFENPGCEPLKKHGSAQEFAGVFFLSVKNVIRGMAAIGVHTLANHHFDSYAAHVRKIAEKEGFEPVSDNASLG